MHCYKPHSSWYILSAMRTINDEFFEDYTGILCRFDGLHWIPLVYKQSHTLIHTYIHTYIYVWSKLLASTSVYIISSFTYAPGDLFSDDAHRIHSLKRAYKAMAYLWGNTGWIYYHTERVFNWTTLEIFPLFLVL